MKKQKSLSKLKAELWKWFALYVKKKYSENGTDVKCYTCDANLIIGTSNCQAGHCFTKKGYPALYFDLNNVRPQCYHCNINLSGNTVEFVERLKKEIGEDEYNEMYAKRHNSVKLSRFDYLELIDMYKSLVNEN